jgi:hypothetical protein
MLAAQAAYINFTLSTGGGLNMKLLISLDDQVFATARKVQNLEHVENARGGGCPSCDNES